MPDAQLEHALLPSEPAYLPDGQFLHDACASLSWYLPATQRWHELASCDDEYLPALQVVHPDPFTYFPFVHTHLSCAALCVRPPLCLQSTQPVLPFALCTWCCAHCEHADAPPELGLNLPVPHSLHSAVPPAPNWPPLHIVHMVVYFAKAAFSRPAGHASQLYTVCVA